MPIQKTSKKEIIQKAIEIFTENGYQGTSMQNLADACGISKANLYHHFKNKQDLMNIILEGIKQRFENEVFSLAYQEKENPKERLKKMLALWEQIFQHQKNGRLVGNLIGNMIFEAIEIVPEFEESIKRVIEHWVKALQHIYQTKYPEKEAEALAWQMAKEMQGAAVLIRLFNDFSIFQTTLKRILAQL